MLKKEVLQLVRGRQFVALLVVEAILAVASFALAGRQWQREADSARMLAETNQRRLAMLSSWSDVEDTGVLVPPPTPAGRFLVSSVVWPGFLVTPPELPRPLGGADQSPLPAPGQVLLVFFSLFSLILSFDAVGVEKAQRTLALLLVVSGSRRTLLEVKFAVRAGVAAAGALLSQLLAAFCTAMVLPDFVREPTFLRVFVGLVLFLTACSVLFTAVGLAVSCLFSEPLTALLAGVGAWVLLVIALPGAGTTLARAVVPPPSRTLFEAQAAALYARHSQRLEEAMVEPLRRWAQEGPAGQQHFEQEANRIREELRTELQRSLLSLFASHLRQEQRSRRAEFWTTGFTPTGLYTAGLAHLATADPASWHAFLQAVTEYGGVLAQRVQERRGSIRFVMVGAKNPYAENRPTPEELPGFRFSPAGAPWPSQLPRLLGLGVWTAFFFALALTSFKRMDPR